MPESCGFLSLYDQVSEDNPLVGADILFFARGDFR